MEYRMHFPAQPFYILHPKYIWQLWDVIRGNNLENIQPNPPSSGFIGKTHTYKLIHAHIVLYRFKTPSDISIITNNKVKLHNNCFQTTFTVPTKTVASIWGETLILIPVGLLKQTDGILFEWHRNYTLHLHFTFHPQLHILLQSPKSGCAFRNLCLKMFYLPVSHVMFPLSSQYYH